jgi:uncharacterized membrane protein YfcA
VLAALPLGLAIGVALGTVGGGGAVLAVPALVYVLGQDVHSATTSSLVVVAAAALTGVAAQAGRARVCWRQVTVFAPAAAVGAVGGTLANQAASGAVVLIAFAPVLLAAAGLTWRRSGASRTEDATCPPLDARRTLAAGLLIGALTGFFGVGGGFLVVPTLALALRFPLRQAIGTSLALVGFVAIAGLAAHLWREAEFDVGLTGAMALGCAAGALAGARLAERLPQRTLGRAFAGLLTAVAVYILAASTILGGTPDA